MAPSMDALSDALLAAYKKTPGAAKYAKVELDHGTADFRVFELIVGQVGPLDEIGIQAEDLRQAFGRHCAAEGCMSDRHRGGGVGAQVFEVGEKPPAVALARAAL